MSVRFSAALRLSLHERFPAAGRTLGMRVRPRVAGHGSGDPRMTEVLITATNRFADPTLAPNVG